MMVKKLFLLALVLITVGCDQGINVNIESQPEEQFYCSPLGMFVTKEAPTPEIFRIHEECKPGDALLLHYTETAEVNYDDFQDYEYRPVGLINLVCDHSKEIIVQVVEDTLEANGLKPTGYKSWDISCIYSGRKTYRSPYTD